MSHCEVHGQSPETTVTGESESWMLVENLKQLHLNIYIIYVDSGAATYLPVEVNTNIRLHVLRAVA